MKMEHEAAGAMLGSKPKMPPKPKPRKMMHIEELHDGSYMSESHKGDGSEPMKASHKDLDGVHDQLEEHFGSPNAGEEEMEKEKAGGTPHPQEE
jgi:hypothetical protein